MVTFDVWLPLGSGRRQPTPPMAAVVKGCRTPAVAGRLPQACSAGVGQASGEETAGRLGSVDRLAQPMGI